MRKFLIIILSLITLSANAQIKDTILNSTLGRSSQQNVLKTIQANEYAFTETSETIACSDVEFAGYGWEKVVFYFYKQVLYKVVFESPYVISENEIKSWNRPTKRSDIMKAIREAAKSKYHKYEKGFWSFQDGVTKLDFGLTSRMTYENIRLAAKVSKESLDDI